MIRARRCNCVPASPAFLREKRFNLTPSKTQAPLRLCVKGGSSSRLRRPRLSASLREKKFLLTPSKTHAQVPSRRIVLPVRLRKIDVTEISIRIQKDDVDRIVRGKS